MCKAWIWKKGIFQECSYDECNLCRFHKNYNLEWLDKEKFTICKRCSKGFENNGNIRCEKCNEKSNKPKNNQCKFITKNNTQCTNQSQNNTEFCRLHIPYIENGINNPDNSNRCDDCGKPHNRDVKKCQKCQDKRSKKQKEKHIEEKMKFISQDFPILEKPYEISPYYMGGFFDGDASIYIDQNNCLTISISQCYLPILEKFKTIFGGHVYYDTRDISNTKQRNCHVFKVCGRECLKLLQYLDIGSILKHKQIQVAKTFILANKLQGFDDLKDECKILVKTYNKEYKVSHDKDYSKINWEYIAGIFDAEGCIHVKRNHFSYIKITQKNDYKLLEEIRNFVGHGKTRDHICWKTERVDFAKWDLTKMLPLLDVKKYKAEKCLVYFETHNKQLLNEITKDKKKNWVNI